MTALLAAALTALAVGPGAIAGTGDALREGTRNGTTRAETEIIGRLPARSGKGGYVTRQSNVSTGPRAGGAAIYGCRAPAGGTAKDTAPCLRASNLAGGSAFEFATNGGAAGRITVGDPDVVNAAPPFTTNAQGVASGLNADRVDSLSAAEIVALARAKAGLDADTLDGVDATGFLPASAGENLARAEEAQTGGDQSLPGAGVLVAFVETEANRGAFALLTGHVTLDNQTGSSREVSCDVRASDASLTVALGSVRLAPDGQGGDRQQLALTGVAKLPESGKQAYVLFCNPVGFDNDVTTRSAGLVLVPLQSAKDDTLL